MNKPSLIQFKHLSLTNSVLAVAATLVVLGGILSAARANELANANLDVVSIGPQNNATPDLWSVDAVKVLSGANFDGCDSETWCNVLDPGGYGLFFKPFQGQVGDEISVHFYQDVPAAPGTKYTLSGYAAGEANFCAFFATNTPAPQALFVVEFLDGANNVIASNALDLVKAGLPSTGAGSMQLFTMSQVTAPANVATVRAGAFMNNAYSTAGAQSFFVDAFDLEAEAAPGAPIITNQPAQTSVAPGATAMFSVGISNPAGASYQWQRYGTNLADGGHISGATTANLTVSNVSAEDVGHYKVRITNSAGAAVSSEVTLTIVGVNLYPVISITGKLNDTYQVDYATKLAPTTWIPLSTNKLTTVPLTVVDTTSPLSTNRFYRAVFVK